MNLKVVKIIIFILIIQIVAYSVWVILGPVKNIYARATEMPEIIGEIKKSINDNNYQDADDYIGQAQENIISMKANFVYIKFFKFVPFVGSKINNIDNILIYSNSILENTSKITESLKSETSTEKSTILIKILQYPNELKEISEDFDELIKNVIAINKTFKILNNEQIGNLDFINKILKLSQPLNKYIPEIIGYESEKRYLVLFQNNTELRPTGGFIGTYGIITVNNGKISDLFIDDIYHLDSVSIGKLNNTVPVELSKYLKVPEWYMRDCNWDPDFPTSARDCLDLYYKEKTNLINFGNTTSSTENTNLIPEKIDGIVAITPNVIKNLLEIIGTQEVNGILFESENFTEDLQKAVELYYKDRGVSQWDRKDIIKALANVMIEKIKNLDIVEYDKILDITKNSLDKKDMLLYSTNFEIESLISSASWSGEIKDSKKDYLMVIDSNLASYKSDQYIDRTTSYSIEQNENNDLIATVELKYKHNGDFSWNSTRYRTYTRIITPLGSKLIEVIGSMDNDRSDIEGQIDSYEKYDKQVFGTFISIEPKETKTLTFKYTLPNYLKNEIMKKEYILYIQKQPGVENASFVLDFKLNQDLSKYKVDIDNIIQDNLSGFKAQFNIEKDRQININW
ncbi:MAG: DUF4012 domain-containing protein [Patescibacteria group bacterium]|nr:DUF4012 domain-containing protein [Patescibacteria group bacterium]MDD4304852.1 DUF4012 domain-containing protein [Patescibacteria group bacterium]MDD4695830.1 DUF4012 domain-containing protein [Patescibacteria group bacterium]